MRPRTTEEWELVVDVIDKLQRTVRAGDWDELRRMVQDRSPPVDPPRTPVEKPDAIDDDHVCGVCEGTQRGVCNCKAGEKPADLYTAVESAVRKADADLVDAVRGAGETTASNPNEEKS